MNMFQISHNFQGSFSEGTSSSDLEELDDFVLNQRFIVEEQKLMELFHVCSVWGCGSFIDPDEVSCHRTGAALQVEAVCFKNHKTKGKSYSQTGYM